MTNPAIERGEFDTPGDVRPRPHGNGHWVVAGQLLAGDHPSSTARAAAARIDALALDAIYAALGARETIHLHCRGGVGRTGTVVGCLLREQGYSAPEALDLLERKWRAMEKRARHPHSPETAAQIAFIEQWERAGRTRLR